MKTRDKIFCLVGIGIIYIVFCFICYNVGFIKGLEFNSPIVMETK